jgi:hypothetical protein
MLGSCARCTVRLNRRRVSAQPMRCRPLLFNKAHLLLLTLALEVLVGTEGERTANEDNGVEADTGRGTVGCGGGRAGLCVALGLGVALLQQCQLICPGLYGKSDSEIWTESGRFGQDLVDLDRIS